MAHNLLPSLASRKRILAHTLPSPPPGPFKRLHASSSDPTIDDAEYTRAWHTATAFLTPPGKPFRATEDVGDPKRAAKRWAKRPPSAAAIEALAIVKTVDGGRALREWYIQEVKRHWWVWFRPGLTELLTQADLDKEDGCDAEEALRRFMYALETALIVYDNVFNKYILPDNDAALAATTSQDMASVLHGLARCALPTDAVCRLIRKEADRLLAPLLREPSEESDEDAIGEEKSAATNAAALADLRSKLFGLLYSLLDTGLLRDREQKMLAELVDGLATTRIEEAYGGQSQGHSDAPRSAWSEREFARVVGNMEVTMTGSHAANGPEDTSPSITAKLSDIAFARLGSLYVNKLFDLVVARDPKAPEPLPPPALDILRKYASTPLTRFYLTSSFNASLSRHLLQPGVSTLEILRVYVSMIKVFRKLDPRAVLLDRVARPIRRFLREREDTAKIIVSGLMADATDINSARSAAAAAATRDNAETEFLEEISSELSAVQAEGLAAYKDELDWNNLEWMPDPIDAAPDRKQQSADGPDIIGSLISLFENKETFVAELQKVLCDRLLAKPASTTDADCERERALLSLLRARFGDAALQACEVMLRDISTSSALNAAVHTADTAAPANAFLHPRVLSHMYWPRLPAREFNVPPAVHAAQQRYAHSYTQVKHARRLAWVQALGRAVVELQFADRVWQGEATTWQTAVVCAFEGSKGGRPVAEVAREVGMAPTLVRSACLFWVAQHVLRAVGQDVFEVVEALEEEGAGDGDAKRVSGPTQRDGDAARAAEADADAEAEAATTTAKMKFYWQFIVGMLTNQGPMPLSQIVMMLKIVVPGGFAFSNEELRDYLGKMVAQGQLEIARGGAYKLVAK